MRRLHRRADGGGWQALHHGERQHLPTAAALRYSRRAARLRRRGRFRPHRPPRRQMDTCHGVSRMSKALVVIDVQKGMWGHPDYPPYDGDGVVARIADLIAKARAAGAPVMYVQHPGIGE